MFAIFLWINENQKQAYTILMTAVGIMGPLLTLLVLWDMIKKRWSEKAWKQNWKLLAVGVIMTIIVILYSVGFIHPIR